MMQSNTITLMQVHYARSSASPITHSYVSVRPAACNSSTEGRSKFKFDTQVPYEIYNQPRYFRAKNKITGT